MAMVFYRAKMAVERPKAQGAGQMVPTKGILGLPRAIPLLRTLRTLDRRWVSTWLERGTLRM
jgi:hypothetical protein